VQEVLGERAATDLTGWFEVIMTERSVRRDEYREVLSRLDILEHDVSEVKTEIAELRRTMDERFDQVHERFDRMNERFDQIHERFERLEARTSQRFDQLYELFERQEVRTDQRFDQMHDRMTSMTRWTVGTIALFGTILTILAAAAQFGTLP